MRKKEIIEQLNKKNKRIDDLNKRIDDLNKIIIDQEKLYTFLRDKKVSVEEKLSNYLDSNEIDRVMVSDGATIVWFKNNTKVVVRKAKNEKGDTYTAVAYAIAKHMFGSNHQFKKEVNRNLPKEEVVRLKKLEEAERVKEKQRKRHIKINIDSVLTEPKDNGKE